MNSPARAEDSSDLPRSQLPRQVLESGGRLAAVEVKAGSTVTSEDFKGLRKLRDADPKRFTAGVVLYDGEAVVPFGPLLHAVPLSSRRSEG